MSAAGLDWNVVKCNVVAKMPVLGGTINEQEGFIKDGDYYHEIENQFATYRTDINVPLGIVKERYTPVQNRDAFRFFDNAIGKDKAVWQTAGCFGYGHRIFVSAKLPNNIYVNGDPTECYLVFTTSHDGSSGVKILFTPIRVICQNTLNAAIQSSTNFVTIRHTANVHKHLDVASEILGICDATADFLSEKYNYMNGIKVDDNDAITNFANVVFSTDEKQRIIDTGHTIFQIANRDHIAIADARLSMKKVNALSEMYHYYFEGPGQRSIVGTAWGVYNTVSGYYSNVSGGEGTKRMDSLLYGNKANKIKNSADLLLAI